MSDPLFDLVAVSYEAHNETRRFLQSLHHIDVPFTFTIVDNCTPSGQSQRVIEKMEDAVQSLDKCLDFKFVRNDENLGYARACNFGAARGSAPYIGLLNCDIQMRPGVLRHLGSVLDNDPSIGVIGPRTMTSGRMLTHAGIVPGPNGFQHRFWKQPDRSQGLDVLNVPTVSGATYFVRRNMWEELTQCDLYKEVAPDATGAFLPTRHYFEETFCSLHARNHGWRVVYDGRVTMIHEWDRSSKGGGAAKKYWSESREYFLKACAMHGITDTGVGA